MTGKIPVAVLGATGGVGQRFVQLLANHPWFEVVALTGSDRSSGMLYKDACHWVLTEPLPSQAEGIELTASDAARLGVKLAFSALPSKAALEIEAELARAGIVVCSNASAYRNEVDVPILLPEVNPDHVALLDTQRSRRGWRGGIVTNANCTATGMTIVLNALNQAFTVKRVFAVSMQALSGAGYPGVPSLDIADNVVPYIQDEEEKVESEPLKMLGRMDRDHIDPAKFAISSHTNRVSVSDGHTVCLSIEVENSCTPQDAAQVLSGYSVPDVSWDLPSTPQPVILVREEADRPQPRLDRMTGGGMSTVVGRLRSDPLFDLRMVVLSHNTIRGAAGGSIYNAELLVKLGLVDGVERAPVDKTE